MERIGLMRAISTTARIRCKWVGEDGTTRRLMRIEWFQWFAPNIQQLFGCEMRPDGAVLHCKEYMTNADSFWVLAWDGTYHYQQ